VNFRQWHAEDISRDPSASDADVAAAKRRIDELNRARHNLIERIDDGIVALLAAAGRVQSATAPLSSESPGSIVDRCSILALRLWHREHAGRCGAPPKASAPAERELVALQRSDLIGCLRDLLDDVMDGRRRFSRYRHFKLYAPGSSLSASVRA
jgi:hypothetical protein